MESKIREFLKLLELQKDLYSQLLDLSEQKKMAITQSSLDELDKIVRAEQLLLIKASDLERRRKKATDEISKVTDISSAELSLRKIGEIAPDHLKAEIMDLHSELSVLLDKQVKINEINRRLLESRIEYINFMISTSSPDADASNKYGSAGEDKRVIKQNSNIIDQKV